MISIPCCLPLPAARDYAFLFAVASSWCRSQSVPHDYGTQCICLVQDSNLSSQSRQGWHFRDVRRAGNEKISRLPPEARDALLAEHRSLENFGQFDHYDPKDNFEQRHVDIVPLYALSNLEL